MNREDILGIINEIIVEEHGKEVTEEQYLHECDIDSFGYAMLFVGIEAQVLNSGGKKVFTDKVFGGINPSKILVKELIDIIEEQLCL